MGNTVIQSLWIGNKMSNNELLCLRSYLHHRYEFHLYTYEALPDIPGGIKIMDANAIIPASSLFQDTAYSYASFADWFRLKLLYSRGGWWVDMDTVCLRPFDISAEICFSSERQFGTGNRDINNTFIKAPAGAPFLKELIDRIEEKINGNVPIGWGEAGVYLFRKFLSEKEEVLTHILDPEVFCPIDYFDLSGLICKSDYAPAGATRAIHLWNEIWRRGNLNKNSTYHPDSIYEGLKKRYLSEV